MAKGRIRAAIQKKLKPRASLKKPVEKLGRVKRKLEEFDAKRRLFKYRIAKFQPKFLVEFKKGHFTVKTAANADELTSLLELRFSIFHKEYKHKKRSVGVDVDELDLVCDHLMIRDDRSGKVVGTYRLNVSDLSGVFYSESEFEMDSIAKLPGRVLELGRAGIAKEYRNGIVIALLWRGLSAYLDACHADYMMGCASVKTTNIQETAQIHEYLIRKGALGNDHRIQPTTKYTMKGLADAVQQLQADINAGRVTVDDAATEKMIPTLFHSYLKMGVKAYGFPALDAEYNCIDYLIMTPVAAIDSTYRKRFVADTSAGETKPSTSA